VLSRSWFACRKEGSLVIPSSLGFLFYFIQMVGSLDLLGYKKSLFFFIKEK
jgi:hypothetical protein